jgi:MFS family permease
MLVLSGIDLSLRTTIYLAVIPGAIGVLVLILFLREEPRAPHTTINTGETSTRLPSTFTQAIFAIALFSLANSSDVFLLLQAHEMGVTTALLPLLWAAHHVIKSLFTTAAGGLSDRIDRRWLLVAGWTSYAIIYAAFPYARTLTAFFVLFIVYAIPFTLAEGAERAWIADLVPADARGKSFGIYYLANGMCVLAGTALFGLIYQQVSPRAAFTTGAVLAIAAVVAIILTTARRRPTRSRD